MLEEFSRVYARIDLDAIQYNMEQMHRKVGGAQMVGVIKTDGYGHGAVKVGEVLEEMPFVYGYAVATVEEAMELREASLQKPIIILGHTFPYAYRTIVEQGFRPATFQVDAAKRLSDVAVSLHKVARIHLAVDTGMGRIGVLPTKEGLETIRTIISLPNLEVEGIFTHFSKSDEADKGFAKHQLEVFESFVAQVRKELSLQIPYVHIANSAAIVELPDTHLDLVRAGITMYGLWPSEEVDRDCISLRPALQLKSHVAYVKTVPEGTPVSYGGTYVTSKETIIATIPVGYGDGYPRGLSNQGSVLIRGKRAPICGRVCMDQLMVDVTDIPGVSEGDEVTLIGTDGSEQITMEELGEISGRFNYELACLISPRVPRVYIRGGKLL
ncbi:MAG: alanine racemase [Lachnospiraceae bacterium]|nr:alanine racemase [Lachnospiraceae bacterium]